jgi:hypothetical protein
MASAISLGPKLLLAGAVALGCMSAPAETNTAVSSSDCADRSELVAYLQHDFDEEPAAMGETTDSHLMELFVSPDSRSWTMLVTMPDGTSCVLAAGEAFGATQPAALAAPTS